MHFHNLNFRAFFTGWCGCVCFEQAAVTLTHTVLLNYFYQKINFLQKPTMQWSCPSHVDSGTVFVKILQRPVFEKSAIKIYVVIYLMKKLKFWKNLHFVLSDTLGIVWQTTLLNMDLRYIIDSSSCQKLCQLNENCGLQHILNTEKMVSRMAIFLKSHRRKQILGVYH